MLLKCRECGNAEDFCRIWDRAIVFIFLNNKGEELCEPQVSDLDDSDSTIRCEMCDSDNIEES